MSAILLVLLDTNIILVVAITNRNASKAVLRDSKHVWQAAEKGEIAGFMSASSLTDVFYLVSRNAGVAAARQVVRTCLKTLQICTVDYSILKYADSLPGSDFEDNLQIACALRYNISSIVTRDKAFYKGLVPVLSPAELLRRI
jgi:predicted nucleic acid-binding protein